MLLVAVEVNLLVEGRVIMMKIIHTGLITTPVNLWLAVGTARFGYKPVVSFKCCQL